MPIYAHMINGFRETHTDRVAQLIWWHQVCRTSGKYFTTNHLTLVQLHFHIMSGSRGHLRHYLTSPPSCSEAKKVFPIYSWFSHYYTCMCAELASSILPETISLLFNDIFTPVQRHCAWYFRPLRHYFTPHHSCSEVKDFAITTWVCRASVKCLTRNQFTLVQRHFHIMTSSSGHLRHHFPPHQVPDMKVFFPTTAIKAVAITMHVCGPAIMHVCGPSVKCFTMNDLTLA